MESSGDAPSAEASLRTPAGPATDGGPRARSGVARDRRRDAHNARRECGRGRIRAAPGSRVGQREAAVHDDPIGPTEVARQSVDIDERTGVIATLYRVPEHWRCDARIAAHLQLGAVSLQAIMVAIKRVVDYNVRVRVKPDGSGMAIGGIEDEHQSVRRDRDRGRRCGSRSAAPSHEVVLVTSGPPRPSSSCAPASRWAPIARFASTRRGELEPLIVARALHALALREQPELVLLGKQAVDDDHGQTGQMFAALWERPQATFASELAVAGNVATVTREVDAGLEMLEVELPAVVTTDLRLNQPRYVKLPEILKAKSKPLAVVPLASLGVDRRAAVRGARLHAAAAARRGHPRQECRRARRGARRSRGAVVTRVLVVAEHDGAAARSEHREMRALRARSAPGRVGRGGARARRRRRRRASRATRRRHRGRCSSTRRTTPRRSPPCSRRRSRASPRTSRTCSGPRRRSARTCCRGSPRLLGVGQISDVLAVVDPHSFRRPIYAGNAIVTVDGRSRARRRRDGAPRFVLRRRQRAAGARHRTRARRSPCRATRASCRGARAAGRGRICRRLGASCRAVARSAARRDFSSWPSSPMCSARRSAHRARPSTRDSSRTSCRWVRRARSSRRSSMSPSGSPARFSTSRASRMPARSSRSTRTRRRRSSRWPTSASWPICSKPCPSSISALRAQGAR